MDGGISVFRKGEAHPHSRNLTLEGPLLTRPPPGLLLSHLSSAGVRDPGEAEVTLLPVWVDTVALELPQFERSMKGLGVDLDGDGIDYDEHALHHLLGKAILTATDQEDERSDHARLVRFFK